MKTLKQYMASIFRVILTGVVAAVVWFAGMQIVFGPAQGILANPEYQSQKFLTVFTQLEPLPKIAVQPFAFYLGFLFVGIAFSLGYHLVNRHMSGKKLRKGLLFGFVAWLLMIPWFEFYLPWNVMHEPVLLVFFEMILWLVVLIGVSLATTYSYHLLGGKNS